MEPAVLASALAGVLAEAGDHVDVVDVRDPGPRPSAHYHAAVVSSSMDDYDADFVIELPDDGGGTGMGWLKSDAGSVQIDLRGLDDLLRLLER